MRNLVYAAAQIKFGSVRKLVIACGLKPQAGYPALSGHEKTWPKLRRDVAAALDMPEEALFDKEGWVRKRHEALTSSPYLKTKSDF